MGGTLKFFSSASGKLGTPGRSSQKLLSKGMDRGSYPIDLKVKCGDLPYKKDPSQWSQLTKDRVSKGLTEKELGKLAGLTQTTVSAYELGKYEFRKSAVKQLKKWLLLWGFLRIGIWMNILCGSMAIRMLTSGRWLKRIEKKDFGDLLRNAA